MKIWPTTNPRSSAGKIYSLPSNSARSWKRKTQCHAAELKRKGNTFWFEEYQNAKANEPRLRAKLKTIEESISAANEQITKLTLQHKDAEKAKAEDQRSIEKQENDSINVMGNFDHCIFPESSTTPRIAAGIPDDFDAAIALFSAAGKARQVVR